jgi:hypothetical protein
MRLPLSKNKDIVVQNLEKELLVYDLKTNKAFCLNETSAAVYQACDGKTSFDDLRKINPHLSDEMIDLTIHELKRENLLAEDYESRFARRDLLKKAALSTVALPLITMVVAPTAAQAQSGKALAALGEDCTATACQPGLVCNSNFGSTVCRAPAGAPCTFPRPDLCASGCCTSPGPVCCNT